MTGVPPHATNELGLLLPLKVKPIAESVQVIDRTNKVAAYVYVCAEPERRLQTNRLSPEEGLEVAKVIARALSDRLRPVS